MSQHPEPASTGEPQPERPVGQPRPPDPERGLRGAMSATLVLQAVTVLLSIRVAQQTGSGTGPVGVILICVLAVALIATCAVIRRPFGVPLALALQVATIACWAITPMLGVVGIIFGLVWAAMFYFRQEFRRRQAAGTLPSQTQGSGRG